MDPLSLIAATALVPGMVPDLIPAFEVRRDGYVLFEQGSGTGREATSGRVATCELAVSQFGGRDLFDTEKRGLPFQFRVGDALFEPILAKVAAGMRVGGIRLVVTPPDVTPTGLLPAKTGLCLRIRLIAVTPP